MKYKFQLSDFPNDFFELETSAWTGKSNLFKNDFLVEQLREKGKPFLIPTANDEYVKAYPKPSFPDMVPQLEINGKKHRIAEKLMPLQYIVGALPILLVFIGGGIGGVIGAAATVINFNVFRQIGTPASKWGKVIGIVVGSYLLYTLIVFLLFQSVYR